MFSLTRVQLFFGLVLAIAIVLGRVSASDEADTEPQVVAEDEIQSEPIGLAVRAKFKPYEIDAKKKNTFFEQFLKNDLNKLNWVYSEAKSKQEKTEKKYQGKFELKPASELVVFGSEKLGLEVTQESKFYGLSRTLLKKNQSIKLNDHNIFITQFEVKMHKPHICGGAYVKLMSEPFDPKELKDDSPFSIMFGPDRCGTSNKIHLIFRHKNKKSGEVKEHHLKQPPSLPDFNSKKTHLYTLIVDPKANTYTIMLDNKQVRTGDIASKDEFDPPLTQPRMIDDPDDKIPSDWDERKMIPDPDFDPTIPEMIYDPSQKMPEDWLPNEPLEIADPNATVPDLWDEVADGEWVAPIIPNPKCANNNCGKWTPRQIINPDYRPRKEIPNPAYKKWIPRKIENPNYEENTKLNVDPIQGIALELWTIDKGYHFDNILVSNDMTLEELAHLTKNTWAVKNKHENEILKEQEKTNNVENEKEAPEYTEEGEMVPLSWKEQLSIKGLVDFATLLRKEPRAAWGKFPGLVGALATFSVLVIVYILLSRGSGSSEATKAKYKKQKSEKSSDSEDEGEESGDEDEGKGYSKGEEASSSGLKKKNAASSEARQRSKN